MIDKYILIELMNKDRCNSKLYLSMEVIKEIESEYKKNRYFEVGGILLGKMSSNLDTIYVDRLLKVKSRRKYSFTYIRNSKKAQKIINEEWKYSEGVMNYLGEWHTHPGISPLPSLQDRQTILELTQDKKSIYFPYTILLIMGEACKLTITISDIQGVIECIHIQ